LQVLLGDLAVGVADDGASEVTEGLGEPRQFDADHLFNVTDGLPDLVETASLELASEHQDGANERLPLNKGPRTHQESQPDMFMVEL
jgi:hypothetical protein